MNENKICDLMIFQSRSHRIPCLYSNFAVLLQAYKYFFYLNHVILNLLNLPFIFIFLTIVTPMSWDVCVKLSEIWLNPGSPPYKNMEIMRNQYGDLWKLESHRKFHKNVW